MKWLDGHGVVHRTKAIRETPPSPSELETALKLLGGDIRKLFNTSGMDYRALGLKDKLPGMNEAQCIELLSKNGNLVKRPFVIGDGIALAGFKPEIWGKALL
jgi:arsenate reductase